MKHILLCLSVFYFQEATAQNFTVCNLNENVVYVGLTTLIKATVENTDDKDVVLTTREASLKKNNEGTYELTASKTGKIAIVVWKKNKKGKLDSLGISEFRAHPIPDPEASVFDIHYGEIKKNILVVVPGIIARIKFRDICGPFTISSFNCIIISKNVNTKLFTANDALFTENMKMEFAFLQPGEQVLFCDIKCKGADGKERSIAPIELTIVK